MREGGREGRRERGREKERKREKIRENIKRKRHDNVCPPAIACNIDIISDLWFEY